MAELEIVVGTYEEFILGYKLGTKNEKQVLVQTFADKSHSGAIKCIAVKDYWIATGSADDRIFIYDMRTRKQSQILLSHDGTVNALAFTPDNTHLLSGADDGKMIATRLNTWFTEATWKKAHSGSSVTHISCHPSGKLALSLGADLVLRTWNLVKGRVAYKTNLKSRNTLGTLPDCLSWSLAGDFFSLTGQRVIEIWSIKTAEVVKSIQTKAKPVCLCWTTNESGIVGLEDGKLMWISINDEEKESPIIEAHNARVKAIAFLKENLVTASSSGEIKMWKVNETGKKLKEIASVNVGCRPTCIGILDFIQLGNDYSTTSVNTEIKEDKVKIEKKFKKPERGVVTIEYENDEKQNENKLSENVNEEVSNEEDKDEESDDDNDDEDEDDEIDDDDVDGDEDDEIADSTEDEDKHEDENESSDDDFTEEAQIRLPKSRKRKQQILKIQNKAKQTKTNKLQKKDHKKTQRK